MGQSFNISINTELYKALQRKSVTDNVSLDVVCERILQAAFYKCNHIYVNISGRTICRLCEFEPKSMNI